MLQSSRCLSSLRNTLLVKNRTDTWPRSPVPLLSSRSIRNKARFSDPLKRDERLLKRLEAQLESVKVQIKREEEQHKEFLRKQAHHGSKNKPGDTADNHNLYFWENVLSANDRRELALNNIHSLDQLYTVYESAESALNRPPFPSIDRLDRRLQVAHEMYKSIPEKLAQAGRATANSSSGAWF